MMTRTTIIARWRPHDAQRFAEFGAQFLDASGIPPPLTPLVTGA